MRIPGWQLLFLAAIFTGACLRFSSLAHRPMHGDEAVHALKFGTLLESGEYRYDPYEYHGPTLNYFTLLPAWLFSRRQLVQVSEEILRSVPAFFGVLLIAMLLLLRQLIGWPGVACAAVFTAVSPALVYYSRYYIQEMLLVAFAFAVLIGLLRYRYAPSARGAMWIGASLGLMLATKETWVLFAAAMAGAFICEMLLFPRPKVALKKQHLFVALTAAITLSGIFFSSFFSNPQGLLDSLTTFCVYFERAGTHSTHIHRWDYYFRILFFTPAAEGVFLAGTLGAAGWSSIRRSQMAGPAGQALRVFAFYAVFLILLFSAIPYKTPWNGLGLLHLMIVSTGTAAGQFIENLWGKWRAVLLTILLLIAFYLAGQAYRLSFSTPASPENPYAYAHPLPDVRQISERVHALVLAQPEGLDTYLQVMCSNSDYWPLPWYLRDLTHVGWWDHVPMEVPAAPLILVSPELEPALLELLYERPPPGERYLYVPVFAQALYLRPGLELRAYARMELSD